MRDRTCAADDRACRNPLACTENGFFLSGGCKPRLRDEPNVRAALDAALRIVPQIRELAAQLRQDALSGVNQVYPNLLDRNVGKALACDAWQKIGELTCDLDPGEIGARDH